MLLYCKFNIIILSPTPEILLPILYHSVFNPLSITVLIIYTAYDSYN